MKLNSLTLTFSRMHIICMSNSRKTTTASLLFFCLLQSALSSILHFLTFFFFFFVDEGKARDVRFSSYSLSNTGEALFPYVSRCLIFWYSKQGFHFALNCIWGSCAFQVNSMTMHPWRTWNLSKGTQTNVILLCTEEYLVSVSHLLCQLFTRNVANVFCV